MAKKNPLLKIFALADFLKAKTLIRCGFELETQKSDGYTKNGREDGDDIDWDSANEAIGSLVCERIDEYSFLRSTCDNYLDSSHFLHNLPRETFIHVMEAANIGTLRDLCDAETSLDFDEIYDAERDSIEEDFDYSEYRYETSPADLFDYLPNDIEIVLDQSVDGFEFRTEGPQEYSSFLHLASEVFKINHEIDEGCSFHIHLSIPGVFHVSSVKFQKLLTEYILNHAETLPEGVLQRFKRCNRFYAPSLKPTEKYSFVQRHSQHQTWEFRCFGNVQNAMEAKLCLDLAIKAMLYAYKVQHGLIKRESEEIREIDFSDSFWLSTATAAMKSLNTFNFVAKNPHRFEKYFIDYNNEAA